MVRLTVRHHRVRAGFRRGPASRPHRSGRCLTPEVGPALRTGAEHPASRRVRGPEPVVLYGARRGGDAIIPGRHHSIPSDAPNNLRTSSAARFKWTRRNTQGRGSSEAPRQRGPVQAPFAPRCGSGTHSERVVPIGPSPRAVSLSSGMVLPNLSQIGFGVEHEPRWGCRAMCPGHSTRSVWTFVPTCPMSVDRDVLYRSSSQGSCQGRLARPVRLSFTTDVEAYSGAFFEGSTHVYIYLGDAKVLVSGL
jgi:hypothetical protein